MGVTTFFEGMSPAQNGCVFPGSAGAGVVLEKSCKGMVAGQRLLPPAIGDAAAEPYLLRIEAGKKLSGHFFNHKGEELGYLLQGQLSLWINGQRQEAGPGDLIYLRREVPEQWENSGEETAELLWLKLRG